MDPISSIILGLFVAGAVIVIVAIDRRRWRGAATSVNGLSLDGTSIEVDCRACGQFNRVPSERLRDHPKCGRCKARLMPRRTVVICRMWPLEGSLRAELYACWDDEDRLWQSLADHVAIQEKTRKEAKDPGRRIVN